MERSKHDFFQLQNKKHNLHHINANTNNKQHSTVEEETEREEVSIMNPLKILRRRITIELRILKHRLREIKMKTIRWLFEHAEQAIIEATGTGIVPAIAVFFGGTLKFPTSTNDSNNSLIETTKKRKTPSNSEFCDISEAIVPVIQSSNLAPVTAATQIVATATHQILVPAWAVSSGGMMVSTHAFWMIPKLATPTGTPAFAAAAADVFGPSTHQQQPQIWVLSPSIAPVFDVAAPRSILNMRDGNGKPRGVKLQGGICFNMMKIGGANGN